MCYGVGMSNEPERAEPVLSPEDRPPEVDLDDAALRAIRESAEWYAENASVMGSATPVLTDLLLALLDDRAALRAQLDAAAEVRTKVERVRHEALRKSTVDSYGSQARRAYHNVAIWLDRALGGSDSPTGPRQG